MFNYSDLHILFLTRYFYPHKGGNESQGWRLAEELVKEGVHVQVVTERYQKNVKKEELVNNVKIKRFNGIDILTGKLILNLKKIPLVGKFFGKIIFLLTEYWFIIASLTILIKKRHEYNIIQVQQATWIAYSAVIAGKLTKKPVLIRDATLGGFDFLDLVYCKRHMQKIIIRNAYFVALTNRIYNNLVNTYKIEEHKIFKIPNGITITDVAPYSKFDIKQILFVGNFWQGKIKGLDVLIEAMGAVCKVYQAVKLVIAGEGDPQKYIPEIKANGLDKNIYFLGKVEDIDKLYEQSSVFVLPSRSEGMSNALLEAMLHGVPCITTDVSGADDLIINYENGIIVPVESPTELALAIIYMLEHKKHAIEMGNEARLTVEKHFDISKIAQKYLEVYQHIIDTKL